MPAILAAAAAAAPSRRRRRGAITFETLDAPVQNWLASVRDNSPAPIGKPHRDVYGRRHAVSDALARFDLGSFGFDFRGRPAAELEELFETMLARAGASPELQPAGFARDVRALYEHRRHNRAEQPDAAPYHNFEHAFDVTQALFALLTQTAAGALLDADARAALLVAALCHDAGHGGRTNAFLARTDDPLAARFGPGALERYHAQLAARLLEEGHPLLAGLDAREAAAFVADVEAAILATDMGRHAAVLADARAAAAEVRAAADEGRALPRGSAARDALMALLLKLADISNVARPLHLSEFWADRLKREFNSQAAAERDLGLEVSPGMEPASAAKMCVGFIDFLALDAYDALCELLPGADRMREAVRENREAYASREY